MAGGGRREVPAPDARRLGRQRQFEAFVTRRPGVLVHAGAVGLADGEAEGQLPGQVFGYFLQ